MQDNVIIHQTETSRPSLPLRSKLAVVPHVTAFPTDTESQSQRSLRETTFLPINLSSQSYQSAQGIAYRLSSHATGWRPWRRASHGLTSPSVSLACSCTNSTFFLFASLCSYAVLSVQLTPSLGHQAHDSTPLSKADLLIGATMNMFEVTTLGQPLEVLKTQMAANRKETMGQAFRSVWSRGGVFGFYQGLIPWVSLTFLAKCPFAQLLHNREGDRS